MKILVACEESQALTNRLRELGHEAFSCDILPSSCTPLLKEDKVVLIMPEKEWYNKA